LRGWLIVAGWVQVNTWVWSAIFHTRGEFLFSSVSGIMLLFRSGRLMRREFDGGGNLFEDMKARGRDWENEECFV
jgi:hypothetical protein